MARRGDEKRHTPADPCPICGGDSWCQTFLESGITQCMRVPDGGKETEDSNGVVYWIHSPNGAKPAARDFTPPPEAPCADADTLHRVYTAILRALPLSASHRKDLERRGLKKDDIARAGYGTMPERGRFEVAKSLVDQFGEGICAAIPGWYVKEGESGHYPSLAGVAGLAIPVRDLANRIIAIILRADQPGEVGKYSALSSKSHGGPSPGAPVHVPLWPLDDSPVVVRATEGALKADVATALSRILTLGVSGVGGWKKLFPILESLKPQRVLLAYDADARVNIHVARPLKQLLEALTAAGYEVAVEVWEEADGKGIDDLLLAGKTPTVLTGAIARDTVAGIYASAQQVAQRQAAERKAADGAPFGEGSADPLADLKPALAELLERAKEDKGAPFEPESKRLLARLKGLDEAEYIRAMDAFKTAKIHVTKLEKAVTGAEREARKERHAEAKAAGDNQPVGVFEIDAGNRDLPDITKQAWAALTTYNDPPNMFVYANQISRLLYNEDDGYRYLEMMGKDAMRWHMSNAANWYQWKAVGEELFKEPDFPPIEVVGSALAVPRPPLPRLDGIVLAPVFGRDGVLQTEPGYHPSSRTFYDPAPGLIVPAVPQRPTEEQLKRALELLLKELLGDFPFVGPAERAHCVAGILHPFIRPKINGPTPLHLLEKPLAGTGAGLLMEMMTLPGMNRSIGLMTEGGTDEEWRKRITAALMEARQAILIDNIRHRIDSAPLAAALTADIHKDRILGSSTMCHIPVRCLWLATGNNPILSAEIARRTIRIRIDRKVDQPHLIDLSGLRHPDLRGWALANRGELIWAALTLIQHWIAEGEPLFTTIRLGSFEHWSEVMGGILGAAKIPGFLGNLQEFYSASNAEGDMWQSFVRAWWDKFGDAEVKSGDLLEVALGIDPPLQLAGKNEQGQKVSLGDKLRQARERRFTLVISPEEKLTVVLLPTAKKQNAQHYRLVRFTEEAATLTRLTQHSLDLDPSPGTESECSELSESFSNPAYAGGKKSDGDEDGVFSPAYAEGPDSRLTRLTSLTDDHSPPDGPEDEDDLGSLFPDIPPPEEPSERQWYQ